LDSLEAVKSGSTIDYRLREHLLGTFDHGDACTIVGIRGVETA
jgi:hypothetical protein